jgi:hypothetical protein
LQIVHIRWHNALTNVSNDLMHISVPAEDGSQQSATFTHDLKGPALSVSTHDPSGLEHLYPPNVLQTKHKDQTFINKKEDIHKP